MTKSELEKFLESRPALSKSAFAREAGISHQLIDYILAGKRNLTDETAAKLLPVMEKYGWSRDK
jgi:plasmid maintenance system antidote protein VapI